MDILIILLAFIVGLAIGVIVVKTTNKKVAPAYKIINEEQEKNSLKEYIGYEVEDPYNGADVIIALTDNDFKMLYNRGKKNMAEPKVKMFKIKKA